MSNAQEETSKLSPSLTEGMSQQGGVGAMQRAEQAQSELATTQAKAFTDRFRGTIDAKDIIMPLAVLIQGNATEREKYPNAQPKTIINNITQQPLPPVFIPLINRKEWIRFNPRNEDHPDFDRSFAPGEVIWKSADPNDPRVIEQSEWRGTKEEPLPPLATAMIKIIAYFPGFNLPVMISFSKTGYKSGKSLLTSIAALSGTEEQLYRLQVQTKTEKGNTWYIPFAVNVGPAGQEEAAKALAMYDMISKARSVEVHEEDSINQE